MESSQSNLFFQPGSGQAEAIIPLSKTWRTQMNSLGAFRPLRPDPPPKRNRGLTKLMKNLFAAECGSWYHTVFPVRTTKASVPMSRLENTFGKWVSGLKKQFFTCHWTQIRFYIQTNLLHAVVTRIRSTENLCCLTKICCTSLNVVVEGRVELRWVAAFASHALLTVRPALLPSHLIAHWSACHRFQWWGGQDWRLTRLGNVDQDVPQGGDIRCLLCVWTPWEHISEKS